MKPVHEIDYVFNKHLLLTEIEHLKGHSKAYTDNRYSAAADNWRIIKDTNLKVGEKETQRFLDFYNISNSGSCRYYILKKNTSLQMHVDNHTTCSVNVILNNNCAPVTVEDVDYFYSTAILNTQKRHGVINSDTDRLLFKISFFDLPYEELVKIVSSVQ